MALGLSLDIQQEELLKKIENLVTGRQLTNEIRHVFRKPFRIKDLLKKLLGRFDWPSDEKIGELRSRLKYDSHEAVRFYDELVNIYKHTST